jgi:hypothetical protein
VLSPVATSTSLRSSISGLTISTKILTSTLNDIIYLLLCELVVFETIKREKKSHFRKIHFKFCEAEYFREPMSTMINDSFVR